MRRGRLVTVSAVAALAVLAAVLVAVVVGGGGRKTVTAYFPRAIGLYKDSSVRILGVPVGSVTQITPEGTRVKVVMSYDSKYSLPADVGAVIVPPSIVSDRYIQLTPAYAGGPVLASGATIPESRTGTPVELDEIFAQLNNLDVALGPNGSNARGALSQLIAVGAKNLSGNGAAFNQMLRSFSEAIATLGNNRYDLFSTLSNLQQFTTTLAQDDGGVRQVSNDLAQVSVQLNLERSDLGAAFRNLSIALAEVANFVRSNRSALTTDIHKLTSVTSGMLTEKRALIELLDDAPLGLQNLALAYDPKAQTLRTRNNNGNSSNPCAPTGLLYQLLSALHLNCPGSAALPAAFHPPAVPTLNAQQSLAQLLGVLP